MTPNAWVNMEAAFEFLLEELEAELAHVERFGTRSLSAHAYDRARQLADLAALVTSFRGEVLTLRRKWQERAHWIEETENSLGITADWRAAYRLNRSRRTPVADYFEPVLSAIHAVGGSAKTRDLVRAIPQLMQDVLRLADWEALASAPDTPRWHNALLWARHDMIAAGWLEPDTPADVWQATELGLWRCESTPLENSRESETPGEVVLSGRRSGAL